MPFWGSFSSMQMSASYSVFWRSLTLVSHLPNQVKLNGSEPENGRSTTCTFGSVQSSGVDATRVSPSDTMTVPMLTSAYGGCLLYVSDSLTNPPYTPKTEIWASPPVSVYGPVDAS